MTMLESLRVALEALAVNKMRSLLTMLGIIIGVGSVIAIVAIGNGTSTAVKSELQGLGSGQVVMMAGKPGPNSSSQRIEPFTDRDIRNMEQLLPDVRGSATFLNVIGQVRYGRASVQAGVQGHAANGVDLFGMKVAEGRWFSRAEVDSSAHVVILGFNAVTKLMGENVKPIGRSIAINGYPFEVIGVTEKSTGALASAFGSQDDSYYVPITFLRRLLGNPSIYQVILKVREGANSDQVIKDAVALVERNHKGAQYSGQSFDQIVGVIAGVLAIVTGVMSAVAGISLIVGGVGIMNIMLVSVTERTREIGVRKAIGATYRDILVQFLMEAIMISLIGGGIGILLAAGPVWAVGHWLKIPLLLDWKSITVALGFSIGVGVIFGVYPASKAARLDPIEALRYE
jgi:putative ABC transport system permease protein